MEVQKKKMNRVTFKGITMMHKNTRSSPNVVRGIISHLGRMNKMNDREMKILIDRAVLVLLGQKVNSMLKEFSDYLEKIEKRAFEKGYIQEFVRAKELKHYWLQNQEKIFESVSELSLRTH